MQPDILFDNIYIGHSEEDAKKFAEETWVIKYKIEKEAEDRELKKDTKDVCCFHLDMNYKILFIII